MAKKKKTGLVHSAVRRSRSRPGGPISTIASSGTQPDAPRSITPIRSTPKPPIKGPPEYFEPLKLGKLAIPATKKRGVKKKREMNSRSDSTFCPQPMKNGDFYLWGPFWSDALRAFRLEYYEYDSKVPGRSWSSSFYCTKQEDAERLYVAAKGIGSRAQWVALRQEAIGIAAGSDGLIYRVMLGEWTETFNGKA